MKVQLLNSAKQEIVHEEQFLLSLIVFKTRMLTYPSNRVCIRVKYVILLSFLISKNVILHMMSNSVVYESSAYQKHLCHTTFYII